MAKGRSQDFHPDELSPSLLYAGLDQFCSCGKDTIALYAQHKHSDGRSGQGAPSFAGEQAAEECPETHLNLFLRLVLLCTADNRVSFYFFSFNFILHFFLFPFHSRARTIEHRRHTGYVQTTSESKRYIWEQEVKLIDIS